MSSKTPCILITGASSGIGRETAIRLAARSKLILQGRDKARIDETLQLCSGGSAHVTWQLDLKEAGAIEATLPVLLEEHQLVVGDVVHCAGTLSVKPLRSVEANDVRDMMNVNFVSAVEILRLLVRKKVNEKRLRAVVFVSSTASRFGARGFNVYCASKGALDAFMRAVAVELAPDVRVNSVLPGAIRTTMSSGVIRDASTWERIASEYPLGIGYPGDVVDAIEFLLSQNARWITGQQLVVDGGRTVNITA